MNTTLSKDGKSVSFETDKFSTYAIVYEDEVSVNNPKTGDEITTYITLGCLSLIAIAGVGIYLSKKKLFN